MLCQVMDSWLLTSQALYLDVLHTKTERMHFGHDELTELRYRLLTSAYRPMVLLSLLEMTHQGVLTDSQVMAVHVLAFCVHDGADRRHDTSAGESRNLFNIVAAHTGAESAFLLGRFCTDVLAWSVNNHSRWPLLLSGRMLLWQIFSHRYQTAVLLDNLHIEVRTIEDPYSDAILNNINPLLGRHEPRPTRYSAEAVFSVRERCSDRPWHDNLIAESLLHFESCEGCTRYHSSKWRDRVGHIRNAYQRKNAGNCECVDAMAIYSSLVLLDEIWWCASNSARYTGPTTEWDPLLC
jgi:hypothetical protein